MEESQDTTKEAMAEQQKVVSELSTTVEKGEVSYQKAESRVQDWKKSLNNAEAQTITATRALNENSAYMQEAESPLMGAQHQSMHSENKSMWQQKQPII